MCFVILAFPGYLHLQCMFLLLLFVCLFLFLFFFYRKMHHIFSAFQFIFHDSISVSAKGS